MLTRREQEEIDARIAACQNRRCILVGGPVWVDILCEQYGGDAWVIDVAEAEKRDQLKETLTRVRRRFAKNG